MEQLLSCPVCLEKFKEPKQLPCGHTFCVSCLDGLIGDNRIRCPECRTIHEVPRIGAHGFPNNWAIKRLLDHPTEVVSCQGCKKKNCMIGKCIHCSQMLCRECLLKHSETLKKELDKSISKVKARIPEVTQRMSEIETSLVTIKEHEEASTTNIAQWIDKCIVQLQMKKRQLVDDIKRSHSEGSRILKSNQESLQTELAVMKSFCEDAEKQKNRSTGASEIADEQATLVELIKQSKKLVAMEITENLTMKPKKFQKEGADSILASISKFQGYEIPEMTLSETVGDQGAKISQSSGVSSAHHQYRRIGHMKRCFGTEGDNAGGFKYPWGVATTSTDNIVVTEYGNNRLQIFDATGNWLEMFGYLGGGDEEFNEPFGVCVTPTGRIIVADTLNDRIQILDSNGSFIRSFGTQEGRGKLSSPWSVVINAEGLLYVTDSTNSIKVFTQNGMFIRTFGECLLDSHGGEKYLATGKGNKVIVSETKNHRIGIFDNREWLVTEVGQIEGHLCHPRGVACDQRGNIIVADTGNNMVQIFDENVQFVTKFGDFGSRPGQMSSPNGVAVLNNGGIVVSDSCNNRIQIF